MSVLESEATETECKSGASIEKNTQRRESISCPFLLSPQSGLGCWVDSLYASMNPEGPRPEIMSTLPELYKQFPI